MNALLDVPEVARLLRLSVWTVRGLAREGKLRPLRIGRRLLFKESDVQQFVDSCCEPSLDLPK